MVIIGPRIDCDVINLKTMEITKFSNPYMQDTFKKTILTIGIFDGVHYAHEKIIRLMKEQCSKLNYNSALMTFDPHPDFVLGIRNSNGYISPIGERINKFKELGIDYLIIIHFTKEIAEISYQDFYNYYLSSFAFFVIGYDFTFGYKALGNANYLKKMKKDTIIIPEIEYNNTKISSTRIRELLHEGKVEEVEPLLDKYYSITGEVKHGSHIGASLGYPTANIEFDENSCDIMNGVYAVSIDYNNKKYHGIANVGNNPSINYVKNKRLEVFIFNFNEDIYGKTITVNFIDFIRKEQKFDSKDELIEQIKKDILKANELMIRF